MGLSLITAPASEPISVVEAKGHLNEKEAFQDQVIKGLISSARRYVEVVTRRQLIEATWELWRDDFPCDGVIDVPRPPLLTVTSITYVDTSGTAQTWPTNQYRVSNPAGPYCERGRITTAYGVSWPATHGVMDAVKVRFTAGYGDSGEAVPEDLKEAMYLLISHWYENREAIVIGVGNLVTPVPLGVAALLAPFKSRALTAA